jgi:hypothetical protein
MDQMDVLPVMSRHAMSLIADPVALLGRPLGLLHLCGRHRCAG